MAKQYQQIVIFVLTQAGKILVEKRPVKGFEKDQYLLPGGAINPEELENLESALMREMKEELGVIPIKYELLSKDGVLGIFDNLLKPFVVTKWQGEIPKVGLDKDDPYPLEWVELDIVASTPIEGSRKVVEAVKEYLSSKSRL